MKYIIAAGLLMVGMATSGWAGRHSGGYGSGNTGYGSNSRATPVRGYERKDGTYVQPTYRTAPNSTQSDNYGTKGNYNPWNGKTGTKSWDDNN